MKIQREVLRLYRDYRDSPPTVVRLFGRNLGRYLLTILVFALAVLLSYAAQRPGLATFALGLLIGALLRDLSAFMRFKKTWPVTESVLDWDRVNTLLGDVPGK